MDTILKILAGIYLVIWIIIGSIVLVGGFIMVGAVARYAPMMGSLLGGGSTGLMGSLGGGNLIGGMMLQKFQDPAARQDFFAQLPKQTQTCLQEKLGIDTLNKLLRSKTLELDSALYAKASPCLK